MASLLNQLNYTLSQAASLPAAERRRVIEFLARWEAFGEALACLNEGPQDDSPAWLDLRAQVLQAAGRTKEAIEVLTIRLQRRDGLPAHMELARLYLAAGRTDEALDIAERITANDAGASPGWNLVADVRSARNERNAAEALYLRQMQSAPLSRQPLLGMMQLHWNAGDLVVAAAYAIKALDMTRRTTELSVQEISLLRRFFHAINDPNRFDELNQQLFERFERERNELRALLQLHAGSPGQPGPGFNLKTFTRTPVRAATRK